MNCLIGNMSMIIATLLSSLNFTESTVRIEAGDSTRHNNRLMMETFGIIDQFLGKESDRNPEEKDANNPDNLPQFSRTPSTNPSRSPSSTPTLLPTTKPSFYPTQTPNASPSYTPSASPSDHPSNDPSSLPSNMPSAAPTSLPSAQPSSLPSFAPSTYPSLIPSAKPSSAPTLSPSLTPSYQPTSISISPSETPTKLACASDGTFGDQGENADAVSVTYSYQVETNPTIDGNLTNDILPAIEKAIHGTLLPVLFETCRDTRRLARNGGNLRGGRRLEVVGLSSKPLDLPGTEECQVALTDKSNDCTPADGALTLYFRGIQLDERALTLNTIKASMDDGSFDNVHPAIVKITFIEDRADPIQDAGGNPTIAADIGGSNEDSANLPVYAFVMMGAGFGLVIVAVEGSRRYLKKSGDISDFGDDILDSASDSESQEIGSSFSLDSLSNASDKSVES